MSDLTAMDRPFSEFAQEFFARQDYAGSSRRSPPGFSQFIQHPSDETVAPTIPTSIAFDTTAFEGPAPFQLPSHEVTFMTNTLPNFSITRQEVLVLSSVLGRIPQTLIGGEGIDANQPLSLTVVDDLSPSGVIATSSQEDADRSVGTEVDLERNIQHATSSRGKRCRPKYSLTGSMFKRHPVVKFSATNRWTRKNRLTSGGVGCVVSNFRL